MDINEIMELADKALKSAQVTLMQENLLNPVIIYLNEKNRLDWTQFNPLERNFEDKMSNFLENKSKTSEFIIQIIDSFYKEGPVSEIPSHPEDQFRSLFENPDADSALTAFIYTKENTYLKILSYLFSNEKYTFMENDWEAMNNTKGFFKNPY